LRIQDEGRFNRSGLLVFQLVSREPQQQAGQCLRHGSFLAFEDISRFQRRDLKYYFFPGPLAQAIASRAWRSA